MPLEVRVEHTYPRALGFARRHGAQSVLVLHDLLVHAGQRTGRLVVQASVREIAERLETLSKDTVNRRLRALIAAGVLEVVPRGDADVFEPTTYVIHLDNSGITVHPNNPRRLTPRTPPR